MKTSHHAMERAAQRLSNPADLTLALDYGELGHHGILVTRESVARAEREALETREKAQRLRRLQGLYVPIAPDGTVITVQRTTRGKHARIMRNDSFA